jgi:hypothetical protein
VKVFRHAINVITSEYWADVTYRETLAIYVGKDGPIMKRTFEAGMNGFGADQAALFDPKTPHMFYYHCQLPINRDIPPNIKMKFSGYLGIK